MKSIEMKTMTNSPLSFFVSVIIKKQSEPVDLEDYEVDNLLLTHYSNVTDKDITILNLLLITVLKILSFPAQARLSWLLTNLTYNTFTLFLLHFNFGKILNFDSDSTLDHLTIWEQLTHSKRFENSKKLLTLSPLIMFLLSLQFTNYSRIEYWFQVGLVVVNIIPKMKFMDQVRLFGVYSI
ncbi:hypothetical protein CONCODRAFT_8216 [Conidiobolus coronatus NRRL 28638]|uniref:ORMDL-domain-containing protein n=1 Tax=Conidiobolus coronatus (strain ATCC 28846 / CBS 209.66 / NRRL 28638) TaxID=796925 RepID=A0A137P303_CONC2|nr:hypothetical protein CONCODRAFT_8216 [Conidiobolus coronatus NRRL 28638]|eukprot:KXN69358.1 hypothetical protein CONCODRAFT_8216 [Conidiobolus coronatus NRRL 28638]